MTSRREYSHPWGCTSVSPTIDKPHTDLSLPEVTGGTVSVRMQHFNISGSYRWQWRPTQVVTQQKYISTYFTDFPRLGHAFKSCVSPRTDHKWPAHSPSGLRLHGQRSPPPQTHNTPAHGPRSTANKPGCHIITPSYITTATHGGSRRLPSAKDKWQLTNSNYRCSQMHHTYTAWRIVALSMIPCHDVYKHNTFPSPQDVQRAPVTILRTSTSGVSKQQLSHHEQNIDTACNIYVHLVQSSSLQWNISLNYHSDVGALGTTLLVCSNDALW